VQGMRVVPVRESMRVHMSECVQEKVLRCTKGERRGVCVQGVCSGGGEGGIVVVVLGCVVFGGASDSNVREGAVTLRYLATRGG